MWIGKEMCIIESDGQLIWLSDISRPVESVMMCRQKKRGSSDTLLCTSDIRTVATMYLIMSRDGTILRLSDQSKHRAQYFTYTMKDA